jgi:hypothetical protein
MEETTYIGGLKDVDIYDEKKMAEIKLEIMLKQMLLKGFSEQRIILLTRSMLAKHRGKR